MTDKEEVLAFAMLRLYYVATPYFLCGIMDVMSNSVRGLGYKAVKNV